MCSHRSRLRRALLEARLPPAAPGPPITAADLAPLPSEARAYLARMGVVGRPRDGCFVASFRGGFRMKPDGAWLPCRALQYNARAPVARIFLLRILFGRVLPVWARDTYLDHRGRMRGRALDLLPIVDASGPELDVGELVTWLNDAVLIAPTMLLGPGVAFAGADEPHAFDVSLTDGGRTVSARVRLGADGAPRDFVTTDRFRDSGDPERPWTRGRWRTPVEGWRELDGRWMPSRGQAVWDLPAGPFSYADFEMSPARVRWNVAPFEV